MTARRPGLDVVRGVAVLLVVAHHALGAGLPGGGVVGVVVFFTLSGYLITGVLARDLERRGGRPDLRGFYGRRARRLVPALVVLLAALTVLTLVADPLHDRGELAGTLLVALTWTGDLPLGHASDATFHLWTLALEEQFYLAWPAVLTVAWRRGRVGTGLAVAGSACAVACLATTWWARSAPDVAYTLPTSWAGCFLVGAALRLRGDRLVVPPRWRSRTAAGALAALGVLSVVPLRGHVLTYVAGGPAIAALTGLLIVVWRDAPVTQAPGRALAALGTISYAAYLWDYPLTLWCGVWVGDARGSALAVVLTLVVATASTRWVEEPVLRRRRRSPVAVGT